MIRPYILCIDDEGPVLRSIEKDMKDRFQKSFNVEALDSIDYAVDVIDELNAKGEPIALALVDQKMPTARVHADRILEAIKSNPFYPKREDGRPVSAEIGVEFLMWFARENPTASSAIVTGYGDKVSSIMAQNFAHTIAYIEKPWEKERVYQIVQDPLDDFVDKLKVDKQFGMTKIKKITSKFEWEAAKRLRYEIYMKDDLLKTEKLSELEKALGQEWDNYDEFATHIVAMTPTPDGTSRTCDGYVRLIVGKGEKKCPLEAVIDLQDFKNQGITIVEGSRLISTQPLLLLGLYQVGYQLTERRTHLFGTAQKKRIPFYMKIGFVPIGPPTESETYKLKGEWTPIVLNIPVARDHPEQMPKISDDLQRACFGQVLPDDEYPKIATQITQKITEPLNNEEQDLGVLKQTLRGTIFGNIG